MNLTNRLGDVWVDARDDLIDHSAQPFDESIAKYSKQIETDLMALVDNLSFRGFRIPTAAKEQLIKSIKQYCNGGNDE